MYSLCNLPNEDYLQFSKETLIIIFFLNRPPPLSPVRNKKLFFDLMKCHHMKLTYNEKES